MKNKKSLGQHWLKNRDFLEEIADLAMGDATEAALDSAETRTCLEIGPGLGFLTSSLLRRFPRVIAVEFDENLAKNLPGSFPGKNLEVVQSDFLKFDLDSVKAPYVVAGNIPYYITSPIITKLLEAKNRPDRIVLLIQKEVAERVAAGVGDHTVLSLSAQNLAKVSLGPVIDREFFTPPPKVDSQVLILDPLKKPQVPSEVMTLIKHGFSAPRKKLIKNLASAPAGTTPVSPEDLKQIFEKLQFSENARPSDLSLEDWQKLFDALKA